jgi:hypothetical protein
MVKEEIDIGVFSCLASRRRAEQVEVLDGEPLQLGFVPLELGNNFAALHRYLAGNMHFIAQSRRLLNCRGGQHLSATLKQTAPPAGFSLGLVT